MSTIASGTTTASLWEWSRTAHGQRTFLVHLDEQGNRIELSYAEMAARIHRCAHAFVELGVGFGDTVLLQLRNTPTMLATLFGLAEIGAIAVPLGMGASAAEINRAIRRTSCAWIVVEADRLECHRTALVGQPDVRAVLVAGAPSAQPSMPCPTLALDTLVEGQADSPVQAPLNSETVTEILYTSGSTAAPKGVLITQGNLVFSGQYGVWQTSLRPDDRLLTTMPACHSNFQLAALTPVLVAGATLVMVERYSAHSYWETVRTERATVIQLISMMARTMLLQPPNPLDAQHSVREVQYFIAISDEEKAAFEQRFGLHLMNCYGSTESIGWALTDPPVGERRWPSVGRPGLGYQVGIFDEDGHQLDPHQVGEIRIKGIPGHSLTIGYHDDPRTTRQALSPDGWLCTGDQGYCDEDGWFYFVDRRIDMIKRAGENISATEVETVLSAHPLIAEAAVVALPDSLRDATVKAFVRPVPGAILTARQVIDHCAEHLNSYKVPELVELVDHFPRTESMKIAKAELSRLSLSPCKKTNQPFERNI
ncbi:MULTISPECIES: AMP-binding protein [unclassified Luteococcus]|uniref:AMP-binding protein n=1 Tax=unclassified Luteococcus TaxID=2639923 RepID=UPI00313F14C7